MAGTLIAEFASPEALRGAIPQVRASGYRVLDAFAPFPVDGLAEDIGTVRAPIGRAMVVAGLAVAALAYFLQWYSAVIALPLNSGGRPLHSWPAFLLVPFEVGVLAATIAGLVAFLWSCRLPCLHDPLFEVIGFERASQDRFFLLAQQGEADGDSLALRRLLQNAGALVVSEVRTS
jgi:hypothetical protein